MASTTLTPDRQASHGGMGSGGETVRVRRLPRAPSLGLLTLVLLAAALLAPVASLVAADWVDNLDQLYYVTLGGILLGFVASQIRLPELVVHPIALALGTVGVFYVAASTLPQAPLGPERVLMLWRRLETWIYVVRLGGFGSEPALFLLLLAGTAFLVGYLGTWFVYRDGTAWWPLVVAGAILVINVSYAPELIGYVLPFAVSAVLLIARVNLHRQEQLWYARGLPYTPNLFARTLPVMILLATLFAAFGWYMPEIPPQPEVSSVLDDSAPIQRVQTEFNRVFRGIRGRGSALPAISGFGTSLQLGGNFTLANFPIFQVYTTESGYWRAVVYERYNGQGWDVGRVNQPRSIAANATQPGPSYEARAQVTQTFEVIQPRGDTIVGAAQIKSVSIPTSAIVVRNTTQAQSRGNQYVPDVSMLRSTAVSPGKSYTVVSEVSRAMPDQLRSAGALTAYPRDVISRYTQLPEMPYRVEALTLELTRGQSTVYDKAKAVESYLHTLKYTTQVTPPPADRDAVDYFLFDLKEGYCDYFASAMAVMLRSVGVPARIVSGYAAGEQTTPGGPFVVRDSNAHSWVEVYFPRYGWITFDPTPGGAQYAVAVNSGQIDPATSTPEAVPPDPNSPTGSEQLPQDIGSASSDLTSGLGSVEGALLDLGLLRTIALALLTVGVLAAALALLWFSGFAGLPAPAAAYARTTQLASLLGWRPRTNETPHEYASRLGQQAPAARPALGQIVDAFVAHRFGGQPRRLYTTGLDQAWQSVRRSLLDSAGKGVLRRLPRWRPWE